MGFEKVFLFGALGDRLDHTFGNLMLLKNYQGKVVIIDKDIQIVCINECYTLNLKGRAGSVISMFSIDDPSPKIITEGLKYNLLNKKLFFTTH
ncbi:MAG: hypothetical protein A2888_00075 [Chlamydiae bacterium RIFCSPLOWO2_01_FULL_28_7]|nr:MAG: hypothetical protein A2888_00075 [Chlamydiae bacterium RIFCSPLOWO2_01_FULL_28_7]